MDIPGLKSAYRVMFSGRSVAEPVSWHSQSVEATCLCMGMATGSFFKANSTESSDFSGYDTPAFSYKEPHD
jgi:hypothetical protein